MNISKNDVFEYNLYKNVLSKTECEDLIKEFTNYKQARTYSKNLEFDLSYRKAQKATYDNESFLLKKVRRIFAEKTNTKIEQQEFPISVVKYELNGEYKEHHDYYLDLRYVENPDMGNRWKTVLLYLNDDYEGGETQFPIEKITIKGGQGDLLIWTNLNKDGTNNTNTLHAGLPVIKGIKYIVVTWIRERMPKNQNNRSLI